MKRFWNKPPGRQLIEKTIDELLIKEARLAREKAEHLPPGEERQLIEKAIDELLIKAARLAREKAEQLPPGEEREDLLKKVRQAETAAHIDDWASSPGLQPPK